MLSVGLIPANFKNRITQSVGSFQIRNNIRRYKHAKPDGTGDRPDGRRRPERQYDGQHRALAPRPAAVQDDSAGKSDLVSTKARLLTQ